MARKVTVKKSEFAVLYKSFIARLKELGCEFCPRRYEYCHHPHMLGQCITWEDAKRMSADGP